MKLRDLVRIRNDWKYLNFFQRKHIYLCMQICLIRVRMAMLFLNFIDQTLPHRKNIIAYQYPAHWIFLEKKNRNNPNRFYVLLYTAIFYEIFHMLIVK